MLLNNESKSRSALNIQVTMRGLLQIIFECLDQVDQHNFSPFNLEILLLINVPTSFFT